MSYLVRPVEERSAQRITLLLREIWGDYAAFSAKNRLKQEFSGVYSGEGDVSRGEMPLDAASILVIPDEDGDCELNLRNTVRSRRL